MRHRRIQLLATEILTTGNFTIWGLICVKQEGQVGRCLGCTSGDLDSVFPSVEYRPLAQVYGLMVGRWLLHLQASYLHSRKEKVR